jgi:hypothetical protein
MPRNASGTYTLPIGAFSPGGTIIASDHNSNYSDIATALTQSLATTGVAAMTGPLNMGNNRITSQADGTAATDSASVQQAQQIFPTGTIMAFANAAAPVRWTQVVTWNDYALRIVSGASGGTAAGTIAFTTVFSAATATDSHILAVTEIPSHTHSGTTGTESATHTHNISSATGGGSGGTGTYPGAVAGIVSGTENSTHTHSFTTDNGTGGGLGHTHTISGLAVKYVDFLLASKN